MAKAPPASPRLVRRPNAKYYEHGISPKPANVKKPPPPPAPPAKRK